jgi:hypothetical protein
MGQQSNKIIKRRRRADYLKRKQEQAKLGGLLPKAKVKKLTPKADADAEAKPAAKKAAAKKAPAKKAAAKKAPAKKAAKTAKAAAPEESSEA